MSNTSNLFQSQFQDLMRQYMQLNQQNNAPIMPMTSPQIQVPIPARQVQYVEGLAGAKLYQEGLQNNSSEIIMDKDENIFYMVSKDANGTPSKRIIKGKFEIIEDRAEEPAFLTKKDLDEFKEEMKELISQKISSKSVTMSSSKTKE